MNSRRRLLLPLITLTLALVFSLVLVEVMLRVTGISGPPGAISVNESQAERLPGVFVPRRTVVNRNPARFPHRITVNSLGYRGPELSLPRGEGTTRVFFAGDSFTWGDLVHDEETLPAQVHMRLSETCPGVEAVNAGVGGTTIVGQSEMIRRGLILDPDLVVLTFYDNDIAEMSPPRFWDLMEDNRRRKSAFPLSLVYSALNSTAIWPVARRAATRLGRMGGEGMAGKTEQANRTDEAWQAQMPALREEYARYLAVIARELEEAGIPLVVVGYPSHLSLEAPDIYFNHSDWLEELADSLGLPFLGLIPTLMETQLALEDLYFLPWDGHPRPIGYEVASEAVAHFLEELDPSLNWCRQSRTGRSSSPSR